MGNFCCCSDEDTNERRCNGYESLPRSRDLPSQLSARSAQPRPLMRFNADVNGFDDESEGSEYSEDQEEPWCLSPYELDEWFHNNINTELDDFDKECRKVVNTVIRFLQESCKSHNLPFTIDRVIKGGSLGKGTMIPGFSDVDLVAFINHPYLKTITELGPDEYSKYLRTFIKKVEEVINWLDVPTKDIRSDQFLVKFKIQVLDGGRWLHVDLLLTADNLQLGHGGDRTQMFKTMLQSDDDLSRAFHSACLVSDQKDFVDGVPARLKDLIRLVKYWAYEKLPLHLQKSYRLELVCIFLWMAAGEPKYFSLAQGLKGVLETMSDLQSVRMYDWDNYRYRNKFAKKAIRERKMKNPVVLDPSNPTNNVFELNRDALNDMENTALETLDSQLLRDVIVYDWWKEK